MIERQKPLAVESTVCGYNDGSILRLQGLKHTAVKVAPDNVYTKSQAASGHATASRKTGAVVVAASALVPLRWY